MMKKNKDNASGKKTAPLLPEAMSSRLQLPETEKRCNAMSITPIKMSPGLSAITVIRKVLPQGIALNVTHKISCCLGDLHVGDGKRRR